MKNVRLGVCGRLGDPPDDGPAVDLQTLNVC